MTKITIIVPIYNVEKYLRKCFDSLLSQNFDDYVIMAVNDGSKDNSKQIIEEYTQKYSDKIIFIDKENGGYGSVLELAISKIESPYFIICDPDDYLEKDALSTLYELSKQYDADITIGAKYFIYEDSEDKDYDYAYNINFTKLKTNYVYKNGSKEYDDLLFIDPSPHSKLYRKEVSKDIKFLYKIGYTDNLLFYLSYLNSNKIVYTDKACAYYLVNRKGNTMTDVSQKAILAHVKVFNEVINKAKQYNPSNMFYYRMFEGFKFIIEQTKRMKANNDEEIEEAMNSLYTLINSLVPYKKEIKLEYKKHSKSKIIERIKDMLLLNKNNKFIFNNLKQRLYKEIKK